MDLSSLALLNKKKRGSGGGVRESKNRYFLSILSAGNEDHLFKTTV